jgi:hypothetical protein
MRFDKSPAALKQTLFVLVMHAYKFISMDPFNIVIRKEGKQLGLNIHPKDKLSYMVFYEGDLAGEIFLDYEGKAWGAIEAKDLIHDESSPFSHQSTTDCDGLMRNKVLVEKIGEEISKNVNFK